MTMVLRITAKVLTYLLALAAVAAAYGGHIDPHLWATPSLLTLAYPYIAMLTLAVGIVWLCFRRYTPAIFCGAALAAGCGTLFVNIPVSMQKSVKPGEKQFSLMTYNILHGVDARGRTCNTNRSVDYVLSSKADIVCLQELYRLSPKEVPSLTPSQLDAIEKTYPYCIEGKTTPMTLLSKYPVTFIKSGRVSSWLDIYALYRLSIAGHTVHLLNLHLASYNLSEKEREVMTDIHGVRSAHNSISRFKGSILAKMKKSYRDRAADAEAVRELLDSIKGTVIVCGDFNDVPASWAYRKVRGGDLHDAYADTGFGLMNTYNMHGFWFHIDHVLYRGALRPLSVQKGNVDYSDHFPLIASFALTPKKTQKKK